VRGAIYDGKPDLELIVTCTANCIFNRHMHEDDEIRFILSGSGFFDVRGA